MVGEIGHAAQGGQRRQRRGFFLPLGALQDQHRIDLAAWPHDPRDRANQPFRADRAVEFGGLRAEIGFQPNVEPEIPIPFNRPQRIPDRVDKRQTRCEPYRRMEVP